ncbi:hypothetical protein VE02_02390 [Pseudogymnoascus sp. 03VT05]|nr:hypothetical protein VE02_02390 [Pseudogymnoascus sp. 03VT05]
MPPKKVAVPKAIRVHLPPLPKLRIKKPNQNNNNPCLGILTSVLTCWASSGYSVAGCTALETSLRVCMDTPRSKDLKKNTINYHLSRMYPQIVGPRKRK